MNKGKRKYYMKMALWNSSEGITKLRFEAFLSVKETAYDNGVLTGPFDRLDSRSQLKRQLVLGIAHHSKDETYCELNFAMLKYILIRFHT